MCHRNIILMYIDIFFATLEVERIFKCHFECRTETYLPILWRFWKRTVFAVILSISICYINSMQTYINDLWLSSCDKFFKNFFVSVCKDNQKWIYETQKKMHPNLIIWELRWCKQTIVENIATRVKFFECGLYWMVTDWNQFLNIHFLFLCYFQIPVCFSYLFL